MLLTNEPAKVYPKPQIVIQVAVDNPSLLSDGPEQKMYSTAFRQALCNVLGLAMHDIDVEVIQSQMNLRQLQSLMSLQFGTRFTGPWAGVAIVQLQEQLQNSNSALMTSSNFSLIANQTGIIEHVCDPGMGYSSLADEFGVNAGHCVPCDDGSTSPAGYRVTIESNVQCLDRKCGCIACQAGQMAPSGSHHCIDCPAGKHDHDGSPET